MSRKIMFALESENENESTEDVNFDTDKTIEDPQGTTTGEESTEVVEDKPLPEIGNLEVDKVYNEEEEVTAVADSIESPVDDSMDTQEVTQDAITEAVEANDELVAIAEALMEYAKTNGSIDYNTTKIAKISLEARKKQLMFKTVESNISLENFTEIDKASNVTVVLESFMDVIRNIFQAIINAIKASIEAIKKFFTDYLFNIKNDIEFIKVITDKVLRQRKDKSVKEYDKTNYIINSQLSHRLLINNKQVDNYAVEFTNILNTIDNKADGGVSEFTNSFDDSFIKVINEEINNKLLGGNKPVNGVLEFTPFSFISKNSHGTVNYTASKNHYGRSAKQHYTFYIQRTTLGDMAVIHEINDVFARGVKTGLNNWETLQAIRGWDINLIKAEIKGSNDGGIRYVDNREIEATTKVVLDIFYNIQKFETTIDKLNDFKLKLESISKAAATHKLDPASPQSVDGIKTANAIVGAMTNVIKVMDKTTHQYIKYARSTGNMWSLYLKAVYEKEKAVYEKEKQLT